MSVNAQMPHLLVLPEDDANSEMAKGFERKLASRTRFYQVLPPSGGWLKVVDEFVDAHVPAMKSNRHRYMVLLIDFDERSRRLEEITARIPDELKKRVFVTAIP
jgi:hypothetical protein